jgi:KaiC/GvpD/RAD55 family RecA-like ATPase
MKTLEQKANEEMAAQAGNMSAVSQPITRCFADVVPQPISWLWKGRIARGKVTMIAGDPGLGKSQLTAALAACVSVGGRWPVDLSECPTGNIIFLNAEDDAADTMRPRLEAAGADLQRIHVLDAVTEFGINGERLERTFSLSSDIDAIGVAARKIGGVTLIVIDPISAYLGGTDSHRNADIRSLLAPLAKLAGELNAAIVTVSHLNKGTDSDALRRVTGSLAFVAAARAAYLVVKDANDPSRRFFLSAKNNLGPDQNNGLAFRVVPKTLESGIETSCLEWEADMVTMTANEALAALGAGAGDSKQYGALDEAKECLKSILGDGPMLASRVEAIAKEAGHSKQTVRRAREALGILVDKEGYQGPSRWSLPSKMFKTIKDVQAKNMSIIGLNEHHWKERGMETGEL